MEFSPSCVEDTNMELENEVHAARCIMMALPDGHPSRLDSCRHVVRLLHRSFVQKPNLSTLDEVIDLEEQILNMRQERVEEENGIRLLIGAYHALADSLSEHIEYTGKATFSSRAIELRREALRLCSVVEDDRLLACINLSKALGVHHRSTGDMSALEECVTVAREAMEICQLGDPEYRLARDQCARALTLLFERDSDEDLLQQIVHLDRLVLLLADDGDHRARACSNLSASLYLYSDTFGDHTHLDEAILLQREALQIGKFGRPEQGSSLTQLSALLSMQYRHRSDTSALSEAIKVAREALSVLPFDYQPRSVACGRLANSLLLAFGQSADDGILNEAIELRREALSLLPLAHPDRVFAQINIAHALSVRYQCTEDDSILREASFIVDTIAQRCSEDVQMDSTRQAHLFALRASLLNYWFERTGDQRYLHEAIKLVQKAITLRPQDQHDVGIWKGELAIYMTTLYDQDGACDSELLDLIISTELSILAQHPQGSIYHAQSCNNLAASLLVRFDACKEPEEIKDALQLCHMALLTTDPGQAWRSWTIIAHAHLKSGTEYFDLNAALGALTRALVPTIKIVTPLIHATLRLLDFIWGYINTGQVPEALALVYKLLINMLPLQANSNVNKIIQLRTLWQCNAVGSEAFVAAVRLGSPLYGLGMLESAHMVLWSHTLHQRQPRGEFPVEIARELGSLYHLLANSSSESSAPLQMSAIHSVDVPSQDAIHQAEARIETLLQHIREHPGFESFLLSTSPHTLMTAAADHPIVVIASARGSCYALILRQSQAHDNESHVISLGFDPDSFKTPDLQSRPRGTGPGTGDPESFTARGMKVKTGGQISAFEKQLATLWHQIVKPVLDHLGLHRMRKGTRPRIHWCPTGKLSFLPLHAAGIYHGTENEQIRCSDFVVSSYTPSVWSLVRARDRQSCLSREQLRRLRVAEKRALEEELPTISGVDEEIIQIQKLTGGISNVDVLGGAEQPGGAVLDQVSKRMQHVNVVHLACHGIQSEDPLESGFCLSDGRLTVGKLMDMDLPHAFLAFCSACETGKGDKDQPDQALHLASAMLFAGFTHVIATMWSVNDADGPKIARYVYEELLARTTIDSDAIVRALDGAIEKLRASGLPPERWAPFIHVGS